MLSEDKNAWAFCWFLLFCLNKIIRRIKKCCFKKWSYFKQLLVMEEEKDLQETYLAGDTTLVTNQRRMNFRSFGKPLRRRERAAKPSVPQ